MNKIKSSLLAFGLIIILSGASRKNIEASETLPASALHVYGRYLLNDQKHIELISSASHIGFTFKGKECQVYAYINDPNGHNYLQYEIDDVYQKRIKISGKEKQPFVIQTSTNKVHTVWIYKATEAHTGPIFLEKIMGTQVKAIKKQPAPLIEFIGNSITCGAAADPSEVPCGAGVYHDQHNAYFAYGPRVARELKTDFILSSVSGIGIYRNWNSNGPTMPQVYEKADFQYDGQRLWDFTNSKPVIVSIALGTNDFANGDGKQERLPFDSAAYVSGYIKFVQLVKSKYPQAQIALLSSPMINGSNRIKLQNCITAVKENINSLFPKDKPVAVFFFEPMQAKGCTGHPNVEDHAIMAKQVSGFYKGLL